jgi:hypothetical protein
MEGYTSGSRGQLVRDSHPPIIAMWLLDHFNSGPLDESLTGDLVEEYALGRSNIWFWRQTLMVLAVSFWKEIRANWLLAIKAIFTGWGFFNLFQFLAWGVLLRSHLWTPMYFSLLRFLGYGIGIWLAWLILWAPIWVASGWNVARLNRSHALGMVLVFSTTVLFWQLQRIPRIIHLFFGALGNARYIPQLVVEITNLVLPSIFTAIGGLLAGPCRRDHSPKIAQIAT